ncbi:MAG TPA: ABC transporter permease [Devosiaceae bacterium]|nr:ABC transporter permease [Devosiaceae bacterium]
MSFPEASSIDPAAVAPSPASHGARREIQRAVWLLSRSFSSMLGLGIVVAFLVFAVFGYWLVPYPGAATGNVDMTHVLEAPSWAHWFGTDDVGNDLLSRVIIGTRISLQVGLTITIGAALIGVPLGLLSGYLGGWVRSVIMAFADLFLSVPSLVLAIAIVAVLGPGVTNVTVALLVVWWPGYVRLIDSKTLALSEEPFVEAARALGAGTPRIIFRYILPNCASPLIVKASMDMGAAILAAAGLGFIGLGAKAPSPEWGTMLSVARGYLPQWWWYAVFPGLAIYLSVLGFNLLGDGLRDIFDPRTTSQ